MTTLISNINVYANPVCADIKSAAHSDNMYGRIKLWDAGDTEDLPFDRYFGDRHNGPEVTHITPLAFTSNEELMKTLIHETAHILFPASELGLEAAENEAYYWEEVCLGDFDIG